ncbi:hypothetical protein [Francisella philomiragia]|uniref:hypothetical protein n=1 Tax=Francisella philomiragia TaxID=28110 RepID=UPI001902D88C|nr:hypothetical protein [Francisella philomiragia]MBK2270168.1 hypothetical protein [Francisella philomiragia]MBK2275832.1 hypothetical protein [Francisella philomiragia]MBK2305103.1 hypothetical protein [Francisella philomiragia]
MKKILLSLCLLIITKIAFATGWPVYDLASDINQKMAQSQFVAQTGHMATEVANTSKTLAQTIESVKMAKRNLERFENGWQNVSSFGDLVDKISQAGRVGRSMSQATGGFSKGLSAFTGDEYATLNALQDNLKSVAGIIDEQSSAMSQQNRGFDKMVKGISSGDMDGAVAFLEGNATLMAGIAQQNERLSQHMENLTKIEMAKTQAELQEKQLSQERLLSLQSRLKEGMRDVKFEDKDITKTPEYKYI